MKDSRFKHSFEPCPPLKTDYSDCQIDENNRKVLMKCWADGLRDRTQASDSQYSQFSNFRTSESNLIHHARF